MNGMANDRSHFETNFGRTPLCAAFVAWRVIVLVLAVSSAVADAIAPVWNGFRAQITDRFVPNLEWANGNDHSYRKPVRRLRKAINGYRGRSQELRPSCAKMQTWKRKLPAAEQENARCVTLKQGSSGPAPDHITGVVAADLGIRLTAICVV